MAQLRSQAFQPCPAQLNVSPTPRHAIHSGSGRQWVASYATTWVVESSSPDQEDLSPSVAAVTTRSSALAPRLPESCK